VRGAAAWLLLGLAATPAWAQQAPILLRLKPSSGSVKYRTDVDAWFTAVALSQGDPALPTVRIAVWATRTTTSDDSGRVVYTDVVDSSRFDLPRIRDVQPQLAPTSDLLRGMRIQTRTDPLGRGVTTRVLVAPNLPPDLPVLIRGAQGLAITGLRLATFSLPAAPARAGDTWTDSLRYQLGADRDLRNMLLTGGGVGEATFRLDRVESRGAARVAVVSAAGQVIAAAQDAATASTMVVSTTSEGELDVDSGRLLRARTEMSGPMATRLGIIPVRLVMVTQQIPAGGAP